VPSGTTGGSFGVTTTQFFVPMKLSFFEPFFTLYAAVFCPMIGEYLTSEKLKERKDQAKQPLGENNETIRE
jgi:hypothetical protein